MSSAIKTNERPGTRAQGKYLRVSAYKAREVLDLIRGASYEAAAEILDLTDRAVSRDIRKVLDSAVANAEHNDDLSAEELFVSACYADEGPTLKRWRPRARGRATRIRKRTCHITVIVSRYDSDQLEAMRSAGAVGSRGREAAARRERVERSRRLEQEREAQHDHDHDHDHEHDHDHDHEAPGSSGADESARDASAESQEVTQDSPAGESTAPDAAPAKAVARKAAPAKAAPAKAVAKKAAPAKAVAKKAVAKKAAAKTDGPDEVEGSGSVDAGGAAQAQTPDESSSSGEEA